MKRKLKFPKFVVHLSSVGNPDYKQYTGVSTSLSVPCMTLKECVDRVRDYIQHWDLGGGNWCGDAGVVFKIGKKVLPYARISYNGRVWDILDERKEIKL